MRDNDEASGLPSMMSGGSMKEIRNCAWCGMEQRCLNSSAAELKSGGQCLGCDGRFDSGLKLDDCSICGGRCTGVLVSPDNPNCGCLRCKGVVDACGVCDGNNSTCLHFPSFTQQELSGIALALSGNILISASLNLQKYAHNKNQLESGGTRPYVELPLWWGGMVLMTLGETGNFLAYAYAPATLVAPLGAISVICNSILAHYVLREKLTSRNLLGVAFAIIGAVLIVVYAPSSDKQLTMDVLKQYMSEWGFLVFVACIAVSLAALFLLRESVKRRYVVVYVLICSLTGSLTVMCVKGVSTALMLTFQGSNQFTSLLPWLLVMATVSTLLIQLRYLNLAMIHFGASEVVPVYYVLFTLSSIGGGMVLYKEFHQHCPPHNAGCHFTLIFLLGVAITFAGVYLIAFNNGSSAGVRHVGGKGPHMVVIPDSRRSIIVDGHVETEGLLTGAASLALVSLDEVACEPASPGDCQWGIAGPALKPQVAADRLGLDTSSPARMAGASALALGVRTRSKSPNSPVNGLCSTEMRRLGGGGFGAPVDYSQGETDDDA